MDEIMSRKLDLYIEKIIAGMNLDESQRSAVEQEFRTHLEESIRNGMKKGFSEDKAEEEAMLAFGKPSVIAAQFGASHGFGWFIFERVCFALILFLALGIAMPSEPHYASLSLRIILVVCFLSASLWNKIEVNGNLRIRRLFRKTRRIAFSDVESVSFEKGHLLGKRRIIIRHRNGREKISSRMRHFRCAALALVALCPESVGVDVRKFIERIKTKSKPQSKWFRAAFTFYWFITLFLSLVVIPPIWKTKGISLIFPLCLVLLFPGLILQAVFHTDRSKKGICWILVLLSLIYSVLMLIIAGMYSAQTIIWMSCGFPFIIAVAVTAVWWKGQRTGLLLLLAGLIMAFLSLHFLIPPPLTWEKEVHTLSEVDAMYYASEWSGDSLFSIGALGMSKETKRPALLTASMKQSHQQLLPGGDFYYWTLSETNNPDTMHLLYDKETENIESKEPEIAPAYIYNLNTRSFSEIDNLPERLYWGYFLLYHPKVISPGEDFLVTPLVQKGDWEKMSGEPLILSFTNMKTGECIQFEDAFISAYSGWIDNRTFEMMNIDYASTSSVITVTHYHVDKGKKEEKAKHHVNDQITIYKWTKREWFPVFYRDENKNISCSLMNKYTGELQKIVPEKLAESVTSSVSWKPETGCLACLTLTAQGKQFIVTSNNGKRKEMKIDAEEQVITFSLSPDGTKIIAATYTSGQFIPFPFVHIRLFDFKRKSVNTVKILNPYQSFMFRLFNVVVVNDSAQSSFHWKPDSSGVGCIIPVMKKPPPPQKMRCCLIQVEN